MNWITRYIINGQQVGHKELINDPRIHQFNELYNLNNKRILELAPLEGAHSLTMILLGASQVVGVEGREDNVEKCNIVKDYYSLFKCDFIHGDVRTFDFRSLGEFDACLASGIFYHLDNPIKVIGNISHIPNLFIWTHVATVHYPNTEDINVDGYMGQTGPEFGLEDPESGLIDYSFWFYEDELLRCLSNFGYGITYLSHGTLENQRKWVLLFAQK